MSWEANTRAGLLENNSQTEEYNYNDPIAHSTYNKKEGNFLWLIWIMYFRPLTSVRS